MKRVRYTEGDTGRYYISNSSVEEELKAGAAGYKRLADGRIQCVKSDKQLKKELDNTAARLDRTLRNLGLKYSL